MRVLLVLLFCAGPALTQSGIGWTQNPANGHWYGVPATTSSWSAGEALALSLGGHLATIRSASEQAWIEANFAGHLGTHGLWIGFNDIAVEGQWVWASAEPVTYTNWAPGNPNNGSTIDEDAAHLFGTIGGLDQWKWNDETASFANILRPLIELPVLATPAWYAQFGSGCPGPNAAAPVLAGVPGEPPRLGTTSRIRVSNLPLAVTVPVFVLGLSNTWDSGPPAYSLPLDLGFLGWPGCAQLVSDDVSAFAITTTGYADYSILVPQSVPLIGFTFHAQTLVLYSGGGVAASNGVTGTVGF
jgi:hypothetical protein